MSGWRVPASPPWGLGGGVAALCVAVLVVYGQVLGFQFLNWDDGGYVSRNAHVASGLSWSGLAYAFATFDSGNWHPLTWLSHMLDATLWGPWAGGHHLSSVILHALNGALLFLFLNRLTGALWRSLLVAALFALHPQHVESVAWVSERKDVLSGFFLLLAFHAYLGYVRAPSRRRYLAVSTLFLAALLSKPMVVTFPLLLVLLDYWPLGRMTAGGWRAVLDSLREKAPWLGMAGAAAVVAVIAQRSAGAVADGATLGVGERLLVAGNGLAHYLQGSFWPVDLSFYYPLNTTMAPLPALVGFALLVAGLLMAWRLRGGQPWLLVGGTWFAVALLPVIGLIKVGDQGFADRYVYLPHIGLFVAVIWTLAGPLARLPRVTAAILGVGLLLAVGWRAHAEAAYWRDTTTLAGRALQLDEGNGMAHYLLAEWAAANGSADVATLHAQRALETSRQSQVRAGALQALGDVAMQQQRPADAVQHYRDALRWRELALTRFNLGVACLQLADYRCSEEQFVRTLQLNPAFTPAGYNLAITRKALSGQQAR